MHFHGCSEPSWTMALFSKDKRFRFAQECDPGGNRENRALFLAILRLFFLIFDRLQWRCRSFSWPWPTSSRNSPVESLKNAPCIHLVSFSRRSLEIPDWNWLESDTCWGSPACFEASGYSGLQYWNLQYGRHLDTGQLSFRNCITSIPPVGCNPSIQPVGTVGQCSPSIPSGWNQFEFRTRKI